MNNDFSDRQLYGMSIERLPNIPNTDLAGARVIFTLTSENDPATAGPFVEVTVAVPVNGRSDQAVETGLALDALRVLQRLTEVIPQA